ncbi:MAG: Rho termination factor N-terminal domain-containing protein, partial [Flavobacteriales bacterium]|nr:Rho termination factor N-terminal domain-containing protein [Flavobacteriales bacterium]
MYDIASLSDMKLADLKEIAKKLKIKKVDSLRKQDLVYKILDEQAAAPATVAAATKANASAEDAAPTRNEQRPDRSGDQAMATEGE